MLDYQRLQMVWALPLAMWAIVSCHTHDAHLRLRAEQEWNKNVEIIQRALYGKTGETYTDSELYTAAHFFEDLTGIPSLVDGGSLYLAVPTPGTADSLAKWQKWHEQYKDQLLWDPEQHKVVVANGT